MIISAGLLAHLVSGESEKQAEERTPDSPSSHLLERLTLELSGSINREAIDLSA